MRRIFTILLLIFMLGTCGCKQNSPVTNGEIVKTDMQVCASSSNYRMAETESGFYIQRGSHLYYADKADLSKWVAVCNEPDCSHNTDTCPAGITSAFYVENGKIYSIRMPIDLEVGGEMCDAVYSMDMDGRNLKMEYMVDGSNMDQGGTKYSVLFSGKVYGCYCLAENDGLYRTQILIGDRDGTKTVYTGNPQDQSVTGVMFPYNFSLGIRGDLCVYSPVLSGAEECMKHLYRLAENGIEEVEGIMEYDLSGAYLKEDSLYRFHVDDGYYHTDLSTGLSEKWMDAQLSGSKAYHLSEQFVVETTAFYGSTADFPEIRAFNGKEWRKITLPEDGSVFSEEPYYTPFALSTEYLFFIARNGKVPLLFYVDLTDAEYEMKYCGAFS